MIRWLKSILWAASVFAAAILIIDAFTLLADMIVTHPAQAVAILAAFFFIGLILLARFMIFDQ